MKPARPAKKRKLENILVQDSDAVELFVVRYVLAKVLKLERVALNWLSYIENGEIGVLAVLESEIAKALRVVGLDGAKFMTVGTLLERQRRKRKYRRARARKVLERQKSAAARRVRKVKKKKRKTGR